MMLVSVYRATIAWFVLRRGAREKPPATSSRAALTGRCLAGQYVNSWRSDVLFP